MKIREKLDFILIFSRFCGLFASSLMNSNIICSFRTIFFPNNAETDSVGHLGPRIFRSTLVCGWVGGEGYVCVCVCGGGGGGGVGS